MALLILFSLLISFVFCFTEAEYNETEAVSRLSLAGAAYCIDWLGMGRWGCRACKEHPNVQLVGFIEGIDETYSFVGIDPVANQVILAFKGTRPTSVKNWWLNFNAQQTPYLDAIGNNHPELGVHKGWYEGYLSMQSRIQEALAQAFRKQPSASLLLTGHSMGAAFSMFAVLDIIVNQTAVIAGGQMAPVYTYGQPRVGSAAFASYFNETVQSANVSVFRLIHDADPVPHLPQRILDNYHHVAREIWYNEPMNRFRICDGSGEDHSCSDGLTVNSDVDDHLYYFKMKVADDCGPVWHE